MNTECCDVWCAGRRVAILTVTVVVQVEQSVGSVWVCMDNNF